MFFFLKTAHRLSRYGASCDWQVPVTAHSPGHRHRDGRRLGCATVFRQLRYVWLQFSDVSSVDGLFFCSSVPLHPLPQQMMVKQDLFHLVTGKRGSGEGSELLYVCVYLFETERHWTKKMSCNYVHESLICASVLKRERGTIRTVDWWSYHCAC